MTNSDDEPIDMRLGRVGPLSVVTAQASEFIPSKGSNESMVAEMDSHFTHALSPSRFRLGLNNRYHHMVAIRGWLTRYKSLM